MAKTLVVMFTTLALLALINQSLCGTEDGSFCPTCADWPNLDNWYRQKEAVSEQELQAVMNRQSGSTIQEEAKTPDVVTTNDYPEPYHLQSGDDLSGYVVIDVRSLQEYINGHIAGALNLYWKSVNGDGSLNVSILKSSLEKMGVAPTDDIAICGNGNDGTYMFWALDLIGQENISLLDANWKTNYPLITGQNDINYDKNSYNISDYSTDLKSWRIVTPEDLSSLNAVLIDAQSSFSDYGRMHLKSAIQISASRLYGDDGMLKPATELDELFAGRGLSKDQLVVVYGMPSASTLYYALRLMDYNASLIDGDWWSNSPLAVSSIK